MSSIVSLMIADGGRLDEFRLNFDEAKAVYVLVVYNDRVGTRN